jgi:D-beta-D-heptose 7-phosphate kinase/D-beta-D-heptose 1-phosphate adenosyltransferase
MTDQFKILLLGDSCIDRYNIGTVDRMSPEAPVPVIKNVETHDVPGMASNVFENLVNFNCEIVFVTNGEEIIKTRYIDKRSGQHLIRVDAEPEIEPWGGETGQPWEYYDAVVISDYDKGFLSYENIEQVVLGFPGPVFIDTKKRDLKRFMRKTGNVFIKINESEYKNSTSKSNNLIVTLGDKGALYNNKEYPTKKVEVMDVCGAGDTFLASLTYQYLCTKDIEKAIIFANIAAGLTVQHRGNYAPTYEEINRA